MEAPETAEDGNMPLLHRCSVCGSWFEKGATEPDADGEPRRAWGYEVTAQMAVAMADALESGGPAGSLLSLIHI